MGIVHKGTFGMEDQGWYCEHRSKFESIGFCFISCTSCHSVNLGI